MGVDDGIAEAGDIDAVRSMERLKARRKVMSLKASALPGVDDLKFIWKATVSAGGCQ